MLALLFPGQGSQARGMGLDVAQVSPAARDVYARADAALDFPLSEICFAGPDEELRRTETQQPAILATSVALLRALEERIPPRPAYVAGHSLGEYSALVASRGLELEDALRLVRLRGRLMQEAVPEGQGAMAAILGCAVAAVEAACAEARRETDAVVVPANYNAPRQTVISGHAQAVQVAGRHARAAGARRVLPLPVSAPFHSPLMEPAAEKLAPELARVRCADPRPSVVTNVEAEPNPSGARTPELLRRQVVEPVRFTQLVARLASLGVTHVLEIGPGRVLTGLIARTQPSLEHASCAGVGDLEAAAAFVERAST